MRLIRREQSRQQIRLIAAVGGLRDFGHSLARSFGVAARPELRPSSHLVPAAAVALALAEIASELYVSVNTTKTHLRSIYRKLGAAGRGEAVRRARRLSII